MMGLDRHAIIVRSGKGDKDRVVMLPRALAPRLAAGGTASPLDAMAFEN